MSAVPQIWIPRRDILRPVHPTALFGAGAQMLSTAGKRMLNAAGKRILNNGNNICCLYQARKCSDNSLAGIYVTKSKVAGGTYYFKYSGVCYSASLADPAPCNSTPLVTGETAETSCSSCAGEGCACCTAVTGTTTTSITVTFSGVDVSGASCCANGSSSHYYASASCNGTWTLSPGSGYGAGVICAWNHTTSLVTSDPAFSLDCTQTNPYLIQLLKVSAGFNGSTCLAGWILEVIFNSTSPARMFQAWLDGDGAWATDCTASRTFTNFINAPCTFGGGGSYCTGAWSNSTGVGGSAVVTPC